jgi:ABC-2 type transport system permease protein
VRSDTEINDLIDHGRVRAVLVIPEDFSRRLRDRDIATVQVILNGDDATTATTVLGYANAVLLEASASFAAGTAVPIVSVASRVWYNPELRSTLFLVPGLIAYISMITAVVSTALSIVREKENGTMEQVRMAPISTPAFVIGKTLPYLILSQISGLLVILASMVLFGLPVRGSWLDLSIVLAVFLVGALGTGLLVSTIAETQQIALQAAMPSYFMPIHLSISSGRTAVARRSCRQKLAWRRLEEVGLRALWQPRRLRDRRLGRRRQVGADENAPSSKSS